MPSISGDNKLLASVYSLALESNPVGFSNSQLRRL